MLEGHDLDALYDGEKLNPKARMIVIDTRARETSFNGYKHGKHVILCSQSLGEGAWKTRRVRPSRQESGWP